MIRWKAFIPVTIIVITLSTGYFFFIDTIVKNIIIKTGQGIFDAKVEVQDVDLSLKNSSLTIKGLRIASEEDPWKNLLEAQSIIMDIQILPIFSKKFIVDEVSGEGITWGTKRKTSGALPKKKKKKKDKKKDKIKRSIVSLPLDKLKGLGKKVDVKKLIDVDNLAAVKQARAIQGDMDGKKAQWEGRVEKFKGYEDKINTIKKEVNEVKNIQIKTIADIPKARESLKKLRDAQKNLKAMKEEIANTKKELQKEFGAVKGMIKQLDSFKNKDYKKIIGSLGMGGVSTGNIGNALFGPILMSRVTAVLGWIDKIRSCVPKKSREAKKLERKRLKGRDILFPKKKGLPAFLIKKVSFSAQSPEETEGSKLILSGKIKNISSNPQLLGDPITFTAHGKFADMRGSKLTIQGNMDYTTEVPQENIQFSVSGINLKGTTWKGGEYVPSGIEQGQGNAKFILKRKKDYIACIIDANAQKVKFVSLEGGKDQVKRIMNDVFASIDAVQLKGTIKGVPPKDLNISLKSNLDDVIAKKLKGLFGKELDNQKKRVKKELDNIVNAKKKELLGDLTARQKELEKKLLGSEGAVQKNMDIVKDLLKNKENGIKSISAEKKKEGQKKIQDTLNKQFKKLFK